jgi:hypothetical protein
MYNLTMTAGKQAVIAEVAKTTEYVAAKASPSGEAYDAIRVTEADADMLERFWATACNSVTERMKRWANKVDAQAADFTPDEAGDYMLNMELPGTANAGLVSSIRSVLFNYLALSIVAQWFALTNKEDAESYATQAAATLEQLERFVYARTKPQKPIIDMD